MTEAAIRIDAVSKTYAGGKQALDNVSFDVPRGQIFGLLGPNGAGKSTLFNVIAGRLPPTSGRVTMAGEDITGLAPHELFHKGLLRTFQLAHEFSSMTVRENLMMVPAGQTHPLPLYSPRAAPISSAETPPVSGTKARTPRRIPPNTRPRRSPERLSASSSVRPSASGIPSERPSARSAR